MANLNILGLVGGISEKSLNKKLFKAMQDHAPRSITLEDFDIARLPFFSQDIEFDMPEVVRFFKNRVKEADAILFVTPEYNRSFPGVLKNAIDWGSRPYGHSIWEGKRVGVMGTSLGNTGTMAAQQHLRQSLSYLNTYVMPQPEFYLNGSKAFDAHGKLVDPSTKEHIQGYWRAFEKWAVDGAAA